MPDLTETVLNEVVTLLNTPAPPAGVPNATRTFTYAIQLTEAVPDAINVFPVQEDTQRAAGDDPNVRRVLKLAVECASATITAAPADSADTRVLKLRNHVIKRLDGKRAAANVGPYHRILEDGTEFKMAQKDRAYCLARVYIFVYYQSAAGDLDKWTGP